MWCALADPVVPCARRTEPESNPWTDSELGRLPSNFLSGADQRRQAQFNDATSKRKRGDDGPEECDENSGNDALHGQEEEEEEEDDVGDRHDEAHGDGEDSEAHARDSRAYRNAQGKRGRSNPIQPGEQEEPSDDSNVDGNKRGEENESNSSTRIRIPSAMMKNRISKEGSSYSDP